MRGAGKRDSLSRGKCLTASSPPGWSGAPISLANQPGTGLIRGLCPVISSLVHLPLHLMSPSPPRGAVEGVSCFSVCTTVYCLEPHPQFCYVPMRSCARRAMPASGTKPSSPVPPLLPPCQPAAADGHVSPPHPAEARSSGSLSAVHQPSARADQAGGLLRQRGALLGCGPVPGLSPPAR